MYSMEGGWGVVERMAEGWKRRGGIGHGWTQTTLSSLGRSGEGHPAGLRDPNMVATLGCVFGEMAFFDFDQNNHHNQESRVLLSTRSTSTRYVSRPIEPS
jgi:hypothetical protein